MCLPTTEYTYSDTRSKFTVHILGYEVFKICFGLVCKLDCWSTDRAPLVLAWIANPAMWGVVAFLAARLRSLALVFAATACGLALCILPFEAASFIGYPGYWFWLGSMIAAMLAALFLLPRPRNEFVDDYGTMKDSVPFTPVLP
jgi:hypothetical protein